MKCLLKSLLLLHEKTTKEKTHSAWSSACRALSSAVLGQCHSLNPSFVWQICLPKISLRDSKYYIHIINKTPFFFFFLILTFIFWLLFTLSSKLLFGSGREPLFHSYTPRHTNVTRKFKLACSSLHSLLANGSQQRAAAGRPDQMNHL